MRDRMERFVLLPFSIGCVSESSIAVAVQQQQQQSRGSSKPAHHHHKNSSTMRNQEEDEESLSSNESMKSSFRFMAISKPDISTGFHRLFKSFKNISQLFVYKEEIDDELEDEIEIGFPTDVKHVTHIGIDGSTINNDNNNNNNNNNNNPIKGWEDLISPDLLPPLPPPVSLGQFQLSMAAQADDHQANLVKGST